MPYISPDGSYLLFSRDYDLFISFCARDGAWKEARKLDAPINSPSIEICPIISPDGKYLFFISQRGAKATYGG
jgi:Tol biopolymer transport system component